MLAQANQFKITDMIMQLKTCRLLVYYAAHLLDVGGGGPYGPVIEATVAKLLTSESYVSLTSNAIQVMSGDGWTKFSVEAVYRAAKVTEIAAGTSEVMQMILYRLGTRLIAHKLEPREESSTQNSEFPSTASTKYPNQKSSKITQDNVLSPRRRLPRKPRTLHVPPRPYEIPNRNGGGARRGSHGARGEKACRPQQRPKRHNKTGKRHLSGPQKSKPARILTVLPRMGKQKRNLLKTLIPSFFGCPYTPQTAPEKRIAGARLFRFLWESGYCVVFVPFHVVFVAYLRFLLWVEFEVPPEYSQLLFLWLGFN